MNDQEFYIRDRWYTYEEAHNLLGLTRSRPENVTFLKSDFSTVQIRKDVDDNTFYDAENHIWHNDINEFDPPLYRSLGEITLYRCEAASIHDCYTDTVVNNDPKFVSYDSSLTLISDLYYRHGITKHRCMPYIMNSGNVVVWYDDIICLYWDDRSGKKQWLNHVDDGVEESPHIDLESINRQHLVDRILSFEISVPELNDKHSLLESIDRQYIVDDLDSTIVQIPYLQDKEIIYATLSETE